MIKEGSVEVSRAAGGEKKPNMETEDSSMGLVNQVGQNRGDTQIGMIQNGSLVNLNMVTNSVQSLNLNLSLTPPKKGKVFLDLNLEPSEEEVSPDIHHY